MHKVKTKPTHAGYPTPKPTRKTPEDTARFHGERVEARRMANEGWGGELASI